VDRLAIASADSFYFFLDPDPDVTAEILSIEGLEKTRVKYLVIETKTLCRYIKASTTNRFYLLVHPILKKS